MSTRKRFDLLVPHLNRLDEAWPTGDLLICRNDVPTVRLAFKVWITLTSDILISLGYSAPSVHSRSVNLLTSIVNTQQPSNWLLASKFAYDTLIDFMSGRSIVTSNFYVDFKDQLTNSGIDICLVDAFVAPVSKILSSIQDCGVMRNGCWFSTSTSAFSALAQYFGFLMKLSITRPDLEVKALDDYIQFENNYPVVDFAVNMYARPLKRIINLWFKDYRYNGDLCRHGNGSVADTNRSKLSKYEAIDLDVRLEYLYKREAFEGIYTYLPLGATNRKLERCSKLQFVPKNISKLRSISMEPASLQFVQQGVMRSLTDYFDNHRTLSSHIKLDDQGQNKSFAYDGSITDRYGTIDLSAASDSVSYDLVHYLFSGLPEVWRWLVGTRSDHTLLPNGDKLLLKKFAPMGSAVCFPIETIIFAAIAELAVRLGHERGLTRDNLTGIFNDFYTVYGDDIIVPKGVFSLTREILNSFGFSINEAKSYNCSPFKESCGGNYHCGHDITPTKWSINLSKEGSLDAENYNGICTVINSLYDKGYKITRCFLLELLGKKGYKPLFSDRFDQSPMIYSPTPNNFHCKIRNNKNLQCKEIIYTALKTSPEKPIESFNRDSLDAIHYLEWLRVKDRLDSYSPNTLFEKNKWGGYVLRESLPSSDKALVLTKAVKGYGRVIVY